MGVTDDVASVLLRSRAAVLCSRREGLPMVLAEAMACGVPPVTYDSSPGVREIVQHSVNGVVVPVGHVGGLSEALAAPMTDEPRRLAMASAARLSSARYRPEGILDRWEDLIAQVRR